MSQQKMEAKLLPVRTAFYKQFIDQNDLVFDVGANEGNRVQPFLACYARVIAVEPQPSCIDILYKKFGAINVDYDIINYSNASLQSSPQEFTGVNKVIKNKYTKTSNLRVGVEANLKPMMVRLGYAMFGSPFGDTYSGDFVKSFFTGGIGFKRERAYLDISFSRSLSQENYYMYNPNFVDKSTLRNSGTTIAVTVGSKF